MKRIVLTLVVAAFALTPALQAGDTKAAAKNKDKAGGTDQAKTTAVSASAKSGSCGSACCENEKATTQKKTIQSPKGALLAKR